MYRIVRHNPDAWLRYARENKEMVRHYSTTNFFRQMPNALLARYFEGRGLLADVNWGD